MSPLWNSFIEDGIVGRHSLMVIEVDPLGLYRGELSEELRLQNWEVSQ